MLVVVVVVVIVIVVVIVVVVVVVVVVVIVVVLNTLQSLALDFFLLSIYIFSSLSSVDFRSWPCVHSSLYTSMSSW